MNIVCFHQLMSGCSNGEPGKIHPCNSNAQITFILLMSSLFFIFSFFSFHLLFYFSFLFYSPFFIPYFILFHSFFQFILYSLLFPIFIPFSLFPFFIPYMLILKTTGLSACVNTSRYVHTRNVKL